MEWIIGLLVLGAIGNALDKSKSENSTNQNSRESSFSEDTEEKYLRYGRTHSWVWVGENETSRRNGEPYPNQWYDCVKCGARGIERGGSCAIEAHKPCSK